MAQCCGLLVAVATRQVQQTWWWNVATEECPIALPLETDALLVQWEVAIQPDQFDGIRRWAAASGVPTDAEPWLSELGAEVLHVFLAELPLLSLGMTRCYLPGYRGIYESPALSEEDEWAAWLQGGRQGPAPAPRVVVRTERREFPDGSVETRTVRDFPTHVKVKQFPRQVVRTPGPQER